MAWFGPAADAGPRRGIVRVPERDLRATLIDRPRCARRRVDPAFRTHLARSDMAETDIEPRVTADERDQIEEVLGLVPSGQLDTALARLERQRGPAASAVLDLILTNVHGRARGAPYGGWPSR